MNVNSTSKGHIGLILDILDWNQSWTQKGKHWNWWYWLNYRKLPQVMKKNRWDGRGAKVERDRSRPLGKKMGKVYDYFEGIWLILCWKTSLPIGKTLIILHKTEISHGILHHYWHIDDWHSLSMHAYCIMVVVGTVSQANSITGNIGHPLLRACPLARNGRWRKKISFQWNSLPARYEKYVLMS